jgi:2Fe-2S ferredoxin
MDKMATITVTFVLTDGTERTLTAEIAGQTLMELARTNGIEGILADCGGSCACATCHVYVDAQWKDVVGPADDVEGMTLEMVTYPKPESRLSCQVKLRPELDGLRVSVAPQ